MPVEFPIAAALLNWYDQYRRDLPWRSARPDPYRVWLSEIMLQQTVVATVIPYYHKFTSRWPDVQALAAAADDDVMAAWAGLGYYARARNLLRCARLVAGPLEGAFPKDEAGLRALPGIGRYSAAAIAAIAFGQRAVVVDGNIERVVARLFSMETPLPAARAPLYALTDSITPAVRAGDFAQALMDLGSRICTPRKADCGACPLQDRCTARTGDPLSYPRRAAKMARPERTATAWWIERDGQVWLVRRAGTGLLGGMRALPSNIGDAPETAVLPSGPPLAVITHVFTHFRLTLTIVAGDARAGCVLPPEGEWWPLDRLDDAGLPSVFKKGARAVWENRAQCTLI
jgi:A/G-specific adenine glycosylase